MGILIEFFNDFFLLDMANKKRLVSDFNELLGFVININFSFWKLYLL